MKEHFTIDEGALDREWLQQPTLMYKYATRQAKSRMALTVAKNNLEAVAVRVAAAIRKNPGAFGIERATESAVSEAVKCSVKYEKALEAVTLAQFEHDAAGAAVTALDHKRKALENLVDLHGQDYFSAPRYKNEASREAATDITKTKARRTLGHRAK